MADAFGRAILDHHRGERAEPLWQCDGEERLRHPIEEFYFEPFDADSAAGAWLEERLDGPLVDLGAGAGRDALYFQEHFETAAVEASDALVETLEARGVENARCGDMFRLRDQFERDRFRSALAIGTQVGLAGSMRGLREFLGDLARVTTPDATAVVDMYDPEYGDADEMLGFRADPMPGLAYRVNWFEYEGDVDEALLFRLFSPDRLREATAGTGWVVADVCRPSDASYYRAALAKR
ncbi:class I SAM-dependent methyltransferase [Halomicrobium salinisoli]|uniref:class I SAM-dependent methyltransferase n=1 Tax=Halomicrobium salinisoli TaxID=2878391 RepID=UPI001CF0B227|nr:class I SAM-dependent methyltransferase [Halomicrobium salinisoli]